MLKCPRKRRKQSYEETDNKTVLRVAYESIAGEISKRQWRRIKKKLKTSDELKGMPLLEALAIVRVYAYLRLCNGNRLVTLEDVQEKLWIDEFAKGMSVTITGADLIETFQILQPGPSISTLRAWGREIGCPLYCDRWYSPEEVRLWIGKLATQTKFKFVPNNHRKIGA
jgi:hypothetical protein